VSVCEQCISPAAGRYLFRVLRSFRVILLSAFESSRFSTSTPFRKRYTTMGVVSDSGWHRIAFAFLPGADIYRPLFLLILQTCSATPYPTKYPTKYPTAYDPDTSSPTSIQISTSNPTSTLNVQTSSPTPPVHVQTSSPTDYSFYAQTSSPTKYPTEYPTRYPTIMPTTSPTRSPVVKERTLITVKLTLSNDYSDFQEDEDEFKRQFKEALAKNASCAPHQVKIQSIREGSVITEATVPFSSRQRSSTFVSTFNVVTIFSPSNGFNTTTFAVVGDASSAGITSSSSSDDDNNKGLSIFLIVVVSVIGGVIVITILFIFYTCCCKKRLKGEAGAGVISLENINIPAEELGSASKHKEDRDYKSPKRAFTRPSV